MIQVIILRGGFMSKNKFIEILKRNFSEDDTVAIGLNKKFINERTGNKFGRDFDQVFISVSAIPDYVRSMVDKADLYICFTPLSTKERVKKNALETYIIAQDIDGVPIPKDIPPSYYWETSPNKYQGIWLLDNPASVEEQEMINRKLIAKYNFDKTSADIVHFYRIPLTVNHKYKSDFKVSGMKGTGTIYRKSELIKKLGSVKVVQVNSAIAGDKIPVKRYDLDNLLERYDAVDVFTKYVGGSDRSVYSFNVISHLHRKGASKEEIKFVVLNFPDEMAKWDFDTVDNEVHRIVAKIDNESPYSKVKQGIKFKGKNETKNTGWGDLTLTKLADVEEIDMSDKWLIEDLWVNKSVGIIGAPPKSFKSTLITNLVLAVASGNDFCGKKVKQGGVIMVQGESNAQMERVKMHDIMGDKIDELPIYFLDQALNIDQVNDLEELITDNDIKLLVLDPMYMLIGEDLNKQKEVTNALKLITLLRDKTDCAVMLVHHSKKINRGEKIRPDDLFGTTFINGWYESLILLQRNSSNTSVMKTFFRDHISGTRYTLHIHPDTMKADIHLIEEENEWDNNEAKFGIKKGKKNE